MFKKGSLFSFFFPPPYLSICFHFFSFPFITWQHVASSVEKKSDGGTVDHPWRNFKLNQQANWPATQHLELHLYSKPEIRIFSAGYACFSHQNHEMGLRTAVNALK
jgi:hypothetical protein